MVAGHSGMLLGFFAYTGFSILRGWRQQSASPFKYLSRIRSAGGELVVGR
jgi:hypothetical protein